MKRLMFQTFGLGEHVVDSAIYSIKVYNPDHLVIFSTESARRQGLGRLLDRLAHSNGHDHKPDALDTPADETSAPSTDAPNAIDSFDSWKQQTSDIEASNDTWALNWQIDDGMFEGLTISAPTQPDLERFNNAERLHLAYQRLIDDALARFVDDPSESVPHAVADYTRGTRPMSAALFGAAYASGIPLIAYVGGDRDDTGMVIPGTETVHQTQGQRLRAADTLDKAVSLFNAGDFSAAANVARSLKHTPSPQLPFEGKGVEMLAAASEAFGAWDRFRFQDALDALVRLGESVDPEFLGQRLMTTRLRERIQRHLHQARRATDADPPDDGSNGSGSRAHQHRQAPSTRSHVGLAADLVANADRRIAAEAYDDALGRLYRGLEYLAQVRVQQQFDVPTRAVPVSLLNDPSDEDDPSNHDDTTAIGMKQAWDLLADHEDELGLQFRRLCDEHELLVAIGMRNSSILAHGFEPVEPTYVESMRDSVVELARQHWGEDQWERALETCKFPTISNM